MAAHFPSPRDRPRTAVGPSPKRFSASQWQISGRGHCGRRPSSHPIAAGKIRRLAQNGLDRTLRIFPSKSNRRLVAALARVRSWGSAFWRTQLQRAKIRTVAQNDQKVAQNDQKVAQNVASSTKVSSRNSSEPAESRSGSWTQPSPGGGARGDAGFHRPPTIAADGARAGSSRSRRPAAVR